MDANTLTLRYKNVTPPWNAMANQRKGNPMTNFLAQATKIQSFGYFAIAGDEPAMMCATSPLETYAAPDWDSLAHYAANYDLCECGWH